MKNINKKLKNTNKIKEAIRVLLENDLRVADFSSELWYADDDILDEQNYGKNYIVSDIGRGEEFEHNHKTLDSALKEFIRRHK